MPDRRGFQAKSISEEVALLQHDTPDFRHTKDYLTPLIDHALKSKLWDEINEVMLRKIRMRLLFDVETAAKLYLDNKHYKRGYKFSTYYGYWISRRFDEASKT